MTREQIANLRRLIEAAALPGPMAVFDYDGWDSSRDKQPATDPAQRNMMVFLTGNPIVPWGEWAGGARNAAHASLICAAVNALPELLDIAAAEYAKLARREDG